MDLHISIAAEPLFHIGPVAVTNSMLVMFIVMALILIVFSYLARRAQVVPGRSQGVAELIIEFLLNLVESTAGKSIGRRIFPLVASLFIFIIFANFSGLLPGVGTIYVTDTAVPILRPPTADLNMTVALALVTFTVVQVAGIGAHGVGGRIKHLATPPFLFPIEVISEFSRIISLSARLFGNVFAGEVLLAVMYALANAVKIALLPVLFPVVFIGLEVLFGTIQALVFALLTLIYIYLAAAGHGDHEEEHHEAEAPDHDLVRPVIDSAPEGGRQASPAGD